jgi:hypothetical protein
MDVRVLNGSGIEGQAGAAADALGYLGFPVVEISGLGTDSLAVSQVRFHPDEREGALQLARHLPLGTELVEDDALATGSVVLVTGADLVGIAEEPLPESAIDPTQVVAADDELATTTTGADDEGEEDHGGTTTTTEVVGRTPGEEPDDISCR